MGHTTHRDLKQAVDLIGVVGAQSGPTALAEAGLRKLPDLVGSDLTTLSVCTLRTGHRRVVCNPAGAISDGDLACFDRFFYEHPLVRYHAGNPDGASHRISDSQPPRIFKRTALYNDYYRKVCIEHAIAVPLFVDSSLLVSFVLNRQGRDFSERDREGLDLGRRPLAALYRNALALDGVQQALARVTTDEADDGWMLVSLDTARAGLVFHCVPRSANRSGRTPARCSGWCRRRAVFRDRRCFHDRGDVLRSGGSGLPLHRAGIVAR